MGSFFCLCDGGLGNRINSLVSGLVVWRRFFSDSQFVLVWPINRYCGAAVDELFQPSLLEAYLGRSLKIIDSLDMSSTYTILSHERKGLKGRHINILKYKDFKFVSFDLGAKEVVFCSSLIPAFIPFKDSVEALDYVQPSEAVRKRISHLQTEFGVSGVAIHLRGTDYGLPVFYFKLWCVVLRALFFVNFKIFTDDESVARMFHGFSNVKVVSGINLPIKFTGNESWDHREDGDYNIYRSAVSVIDGYTELLYLASLRKIYTSRSTFLYNAFALSDRKFGLAFRFVYEVNRFVSIFRIFRIKRR